ncbi:MAG TPA: HAD family phosphatase [Paludibacter sp.]|nr:HAD family phosphatase [Paludibacter sp.]
MRQFNNISTLIFDFGGVIINLDLPGCIMNFKNLGVRNIEKHLSKFGQSDFFLHFEKGLIGVEDFRSEIRKYSRNPLEDAQIDEAWCSFLCDIPAGKLEMLAELRKKFRLVLLSNTNPLHIEVSAAGEFAKNGKTLYDYFDSCYLSYELKMVKPHAEIFEALLKSEQVAPERCLFLDDGQKNIEQAQKIGMQTYLVGENEDLSFLLNDETWN